MSKEAEVETSATGTADVRIVLGTMTFSGQTDKAATIKQLETFAAMNTLETRDKAELDTARMYTWGKTEELLGEVFSESEELRSKYFTASKVNPFKGFNDNLRPENVKKQSGEILEALKADYTDILYLHAPDLDTPIEKTLEAMNELHRAGKFRELGLSNYPAWAVVDIWHICDRNGWVKPTVYQGMYNALVRDVERELFPALRRLNMRFYAYNPLAGGMLTGKHKSAGSTPEENTRFNSGFATMYRARYWHGAIFDALEVVRKACEESGVSMVEASFRWLRHHSELKGASNDGIIIGASSQGHLEANMKALLQDPLPEEVVKAMDMACDVAKPVCPKYFRP